MFNDFDFSLLDTPEFKEDSVREELLVPILRRLGYSASPPNQIQRSIALEHPYVYIGTQRKKISIFPDYILSKDNKRFLVIDAKAPSEEILSGKNVEQAYSYAIHKDVRASLFALCNGRAFSLFHVSRFPEILHFPIQEIEDSWKDLVALLGTDVERVNELFVPDLGIGMVRLGIASTLKSKPVIVFPVIDVHLVARIDATHFSFQSYLSYDGTTFLGTFDFHQDSLEGFLNSIDPFERRQSIANALHANPFTWRFTGENFAFTGFSCRISDHILSTKNEQYIPFSVLEFLPSAHSITSEGTQNPDPS